MSEVMENGEKFYLMPKVQKKGSYHRASWALLFDVKPEIAFK